MPGLAKQKGHAIMSYDSWKLDNDENPHADRLADRCSDAERFLKQNLTQAARQANAAAVSRWETQEVLAEADDDDEIWVELTLRLHRIPADKQGHELSEVADALIDLGSRLARLAKREPAASASSGNALDIKMAPSARSRASGNRDADTG